MNAPVIPNPLESTETASRLRTQCLSLLMGAQNTDGGWGFRAGQSSRVEPTCWALRALGRHQFESASLSRATHFLRAAQLADGSWPASPEIKSGSWVTSLACSLLRDDSRSAANVKAGLKWLCDDFPRDSSPLYRFVQRLLSKPNFNSFNDSYRGWGWTPRTSSWVEPTAFALMALQEADPRQLPGNALRRRELAVALLYDRMCPGGGWNCGNPRVYGVDGDPLVLATCWALLALHTLPVSRENAALEIAADDASKIVPEGASNKDVAPEKPGRAMSLAWLQREFPNIQSAGSLAIAQMTLENYGMALPNAKVSLQNFSAQDLAEQGTHVVAWACMALDSARPWPPIAARKSAAAPQNQPQNQPKHQPKDEPKNQPENEQRSAQ